MTKGKKDQKPKEPEFDSDSDSEIENDNEMETSVDVGYIDPDLYLESTEIERIMTKTLMKAPFFNSKVGGKPSWLNYFNLPLAVGTVSIDNNNVSEKPVRLECNNCESQLKFLLQLYAPISVNDQFYNRLANNEDVFHRVLYIFMCTNNKCLPISSRSLKIYRSQLKRTNKFFNSSPPPDTNTGNHENDQKTADNHLLEFYKGLYEKNLFSNCVICGLLSTKKCAKCAFAHYCSQGHQVFDWKSENHKGVCEGYLHWSTNDIDVDELIKLYIEKENAPGATSDLNNGLNEHVFPEYEIAIEPEVIPARSEKKIKKEKKFDEEKLALELENNLALDQDLDNVKETECDRDFEKFNKRTKDEPTQIIRYDRGGTPLWVTKYEKLKVESSIPNCTHCGSKRIFEFQVNPQLLNYLCIDEGHQTNGIDWAGLYVYTCIKSCSAANKSCVEEFIYKQEFV